MRDCYKILHSSTLYYVCDDPFVFGDLSFIHLRLDVLYGGNIVSLHFLLVLILLVLSAHVFNLLYDRSGNCRVLIQRRVQQVLFPGVESSFTGRYRV